MNSLEIRSYKTELRSLDQDSRSIHGLAIPVNSRSEMLIDHRGNKFYEYIDPEAISAEFINSQDISLYLNHDSSQGTYGRSKFGQGTLNLQVTERGLEFDVDLPNTVFGDALLEGIRRGDFDAISFAFRANDEEITPNSDGTYNRRVKSFSIMTEISVLSVLPAYDATKVAVRSLEDYIDAEEKRYNESVEKLNAATDELNNLYKEYLDMAF